MLLLARSITHPNGPKRNFGPFLKADKKGQTGEVTLTKISVYACYIKAYLHEFFELILIN